MTTFDPEIASFRRYVRSENKSDNTVRIYTDAAARFARWLGEQSADGEISAATCWQEVSADHIRGWMIALLDSASDGYANNQYRSVQQFFRWYAVEEDVPNPMTGVSPPHVPEQPVPVLRKEQLAALLKCCSGKSFVDRRDTAILHMFMDAGVRRAEMANMMVTDIDLDLRETRVHGKGRRNRVVTFGRKAAVAVDRYVRERARQKWADDPHLWLAEKNRGALTGWGIYQMLKRRGQMAGIPEVFPHRCWIATPPRPRTSVSGRAVSAGRSATNSEAPLRLGALVGPTGLPGLG